MKTQLLSRLWVVVALMMGARSGFANVTGGVDPSYVKVKAYEIRVSPNADCTNAITVFRNASPDYLDMVNNPTLGSGAIPNGTYNCVMMRMSDFIHFTPASISGAWTHPGLCAPGTDYHADVGHDETSVDPDGTSHVLGPKGTEDIIWLYIRTGVTNGNNNQNAFAPTGGIPLLSPLIVHGDGTHTMVFDFSGAVGEEQDNGVFSCDCDAPTLSFR